MFISGGAQLSRPSYIGISSIYTYAILIESQYTVTHFTYFQSTAFCHDPSSARSDHYLSCNTLSDSDVPVSRSQGYIQSGKESHGAGPIRARAGRRSTWTAVQRQQSL